MTDPNRSVIRCCYPRSPLIAIILLAVIPLALPSQQPSGDIKEDEPEIAKEGPLVAVRGLVRNTITGEPIAHVLVRVDASTPLGLLTDSQGRFEFGQVPSGQITFTIKKP